MYQLQNHKTVCNFKKRIQTDVISLRQSLQHEKSPTITCSLSAGLIKIGLSGDNPQLLQTEAETVYMKHKQKVNSGSRAQHRILYVQHCPAVPVMQAERCQLK